MNKRNIFGIFVILIGVLFLLDTLGYTESGDIISTYWPVILIVFGLMNIFDNSSFKVFGVVLVFIGVFFQLKNLEVDFLKGIDIGNLIWPVILIIVGVWLIIPKKKLGRNISSTNKLDNIAIFSGGNVINQSDDFAGGDLIAVFGGLDVDLRNARIVGSEPVIIDVFTAFGGVDIVVPEDWMVQVKGIPLFGGWSNKARKVNKEVNEAPTLIVKGFVLFGGMEVKCKPE